MNKISWFFLPCCFLIVKSIPTPDVNLVLQKLPRDDSLYNMTWVLTGEYLNSGVAWIQSIDIGKTQTYGSQYVPDLYREYSCNINNRTPCSKFWTRNDWEIQNSYIINLDVVTDKRWEDFTEIYTNGTTVFQHVQRFSKDIKNKLTINFSVRVEQEAHIFLCNDENPAKANCYWILLGGFKGTRTAIRKCEKQIPDSLDKYPTKPCKTLQAEILIPSSEFLSIDEWKHFSISIDKNKIVMKSVSNNVTLLNWSDMEENYIDIYHLIVRSTTKKAYWKFNNYEFTYTTNSSVDEAQQLVGERIYIMDNKLCISFYVAMCAQCSLIIRGFNLSDNANNIVFENTIQPLKEFEWQQVKLSMSFPTNGLVIQLYEERRCSNSCHEQFWAIDDFRLCNEAEVRVFNVHGNALDSSFQILASPSRSNNLKLSVSSVRNVAQFSDATCPTGTIGSTTCTNCSHIFGDNKKYCEASIICDFAIDTEGICRCSPGYTGKTCQNYCPRLKYGNGCKEDCGFCAYVECNRITGFCTVREQCFSNFKGPQCKIPPYPVLTNSPILIESGDTQIVIQIPDFSHHGWGTPTKYKVIYELTDDNSTLYETDSYPIYNPKPNVTLSRLSSDTSYRIRVVLLTSKDEFYNGTFSVPTIIANTTCSDIEEGDVNVTSTNNSTVITFRNNPELCPIKHYEIKFMTNVLSGTTDNEFHIPNLAPGTDYNITITNKHKPTKILHCNFRTKEEAPSTVQSPEVISSNATSLTISWKQPLKLNGILRHYRINLKHRRYLACDQNDNIENIISLQQESTNITLNNLIPYSQYIIEIAGVTVEVGEFSGIIGNTGETDTPDELETPTRANVQPFSTIAQITLKQADCSLFKGNIEYYFTANCTSKWCNNNMTTTLNTSYYFAKKEFNITGLLPYSTYIMDIKVGRTNGNLYNGELSPTQFNTLSGVPNAAKFHIYEESNDILRLRITPPYPPTGELEQYYVKYCPVYTCNSPIWKCNEDYFEAVTCKIWPEYHCLDIFKNLEGEKWYRIFVQARNKGIEVLGPKTHECERTAQRNSHAPTELNYSWDNYYNLTLQWNHPCTTNGPLTKFRITILKIKNECNSSDYMVSEKTTKLTYNYVISINNQDCYTSKLTVLIQSFNEKAGDRATLEIDSPPEAPTLNTRVESVSNTTITIALSAKQRQRSSLFSKSYMYIVLSESKSKFEIGNVEDALYNLQNLETLLHAWLIGEYNLITEIPIETKLTIGSNNSSNLLQSNFSSSEIKLIPNTSYTITILMYNEYQGRKRYRVYEIVKSTSGTTITPNDSINGALFSLILIVLLPLLFWIFVRKRKTGKWCSCISNAPHMPLAFKARVRGSPDVIPLAKNPSISKKQSIAPKPRIPSRNPSSNSSTVTKVNENRIINKFSKPIKITEFDKYVKDAITNGELEKQHSLFVRGKTKPWDYGALPQNKSKNRYNNLIAYDHTRVKLEKINDDPYSDYINANYIDGYKSKNAYIATQGPKASTLNDFWRMIWQDNVKYIVMLANVVEGGKKKTEQYWPNINETMQYGNISVKYKSTEVSADYEYRTFLISLNNTERQIEQLHFTSWPDHGVPMYSQSLVPLFRKLLTISQGNSPIVVHCSAGVGRTGTVILCDLCLRMSAHEGVIDVLKHQHNIREQRANLVDNLEQYKLVHLVLLECLINPDSSITCDEEAEKNILRLLETDKLEKQFHHISEIAWQDQAMRPLLEVNQKPEWKLKNRVEDISTSGYGRVYLSRYPITDEHSDYINAVEVDGFKAPNKFIATQQPLPNTISDFWRMIDEKDISTIVSLNSINKENNRSCVFWPTLKISEIQPVPYLLIKFVNKISNEEITIINLQLHNKNNKDIPKRDINLIKLKDWPADQLLPNSNVSLLKLWNETEKLSQDTHPIVVTCYDGATSCGLFLAFTFTMEKIKLEHQCDVCLAVRTVRHNRQQFVQSLDQFNYLYRAAIAYLNCFELYANFS